MNPKQWKLADRAIPINSFLERFVLAESLLYASCIDLSMRIVIVTAHYSLSSYCKSIIQKELKNNVKFQCTFGKNCDIMCLINILHRQRCRELIRRNAECSGNRKDIIR